MLAAHHPPPWLAGSVNHGGATGAIGDDSWTAVPAIQCLSPGNVVFIAGHAGEDASIEITLDHDPDSDLVSACVQGDDDDPYWLSEDDRRS